MHEYLVNNYQSVCGYGTDDCSCDQVDMNTDQVGGKFEDTALRDCHSLLRVFASNSRVSGSIPDFFQNLEHFECRNCQGLEGTIPENAFGAELISLSLTNTGLYGTIPDSIFGGKTNLRIFNFAGNIGINGTLPASIGDAVALEEFDIWQCPLTGQLPSQIGNLVLLKKLELGGYVAIDHSIS